MRNEGVVILSYFASWLAVVTPKKTLHRKNTISAHTNTHTHAHTYTHTHIHTHTTHTHTHTHKETHTQASTHIHTTHTFGLECPFGLHTLTLTHTHTHSLTHIHSHTHTHTHTDTHTHKHTHISTHTRTRTRRIVKYRRVTKAKVMQFEDIVIACRVFNSIISDMFAENSEKLRKSVSWMLAGADKLVLNCETQAAILK